MNAEHDNIIAVGQPLPRIVGVVPMSGRKVKIMWLSGTTATVDLAPVFASRRAYIPLRNDDALFATVRVGEYGNHLAWEGGLDLSAAWIARLPEAGFTNQEFRAAMDRLGYSLDGMAASLEISRRKVADYRKDEHIPQHIALATRYLVSQRESEGGPRPRA